MWEPFQDSRIHLEVSFPIRIGDIFDYPYRECWPMLEALVRNIGADRLVWGTDMPFQNRFCTYRQSRDYIEKYAPAFLDAGQIADDHGRHRRPPAGPAREGAGHRGCRRLSRRAARSDQLTVRIHTVTGRDRTVGARADAHARAHVLRRGGRARRLRRHRRRRGDARRRARGRTRPPADRGWWT